MARASVAKTRITARFSRDESGAWLVSFPSIPGAHTYGRTLRTARGRIPEVLRLFDVEPDHVEINEEYDLADSARKAIGDLRAARQELERALDVNRRLLDKTLAELREQMRLSTRDAGDILGISHQRVAQLQRSGARSRARRAGPAKRSNKTPSRTNA